MVYGLWSVVYGFWSMIYGLWSMVRRLALRRDVISSTTRFSYTPSSFCSPRPKHRPPQTHTRTHTHTAPTPRQPEPAAAITSASRQYHVCITSASRLHHGCDGPPRPLTPRPPTHPETRDPSRSTAPGGRAGPPTRARWGGAKIKRGEGGGLAHAHVNAHSRAHTQKHACARTHTHMCGRM